MDDGKHPCQCGNFSPSRTPSWSYPTTSLLAHRRFGMACIAELGDPLEIASALREVVLWDPSGLPRSVVLPFGQLTYLRAILTNETHLPAILQCTPDLERAS